MKKTEKKYLKCKYCKKDIIERYGWGKGFYHRFTVSSRCSDDKHFAEPRGKDNE